MHATCRAQHAARPALMAVAPTSVTIRTGLLPAIFTDRESIRPTKSTAAATMMQVLDVAACRTQAGEH